MVVWQIRFLLDKFDQSWIGSISFSSLVKRKKIKMDSRQMKFGKLDSTLLVYPREIEKIAECFRKSTEILSPETMFFLLNFNGIK